MPADTYAIAVGGGGTGNACAAATAAMERAGDAALDRTAENAVGRLGAREEFDGEITVDVEPVAHV